MAGLAPNQRICDVLAEIQRGTYRIPNIQRDYEWDENRITKLLDSVMSGYPFGAIMVWRPRPDVAKDIPTRAFLKHHDTARSHVTDPLPPSPDDAYLVLDGQQRLQSLFLSFYGTYNAKSAHLKIDHIPSDLEEDTDYVFQFLTKEEAADRPAMVPLIDILKLDSDSKYEFAQELARRVDPAARSVAVIAKNIDRFIERFNIRQSLLFQEIDSRLEYDKVLEIFERVNSGGMVLEKADLLFSTLKLKLQQMEHRFAATLQFLEHGARYEFGTDFLIKASLVVFDQRAKYAVSKLKDERYLDAVKARYVDLDHCCRHLSVWLDESARIKCSRFLRSRLALIPLIDWMMLTRKHDKPDGQDARAMTEYLYMAMFRRLFRSPDTVLDQLHTLLSEAAGDARSRFPIERIREYAVQRQRAAWELAPRYLEDDADLALNIVDGGVLQMDPADSQRHPKDLKLEVDHIFPRAPLSKQGLEDVVNHLGNYRLVVMPVNRRKLARMPDASTAFFGRQDEAVESAYAACLEDLGSDSLPTRTSFVAFRDRRAALIAESVSAFLGVPLSKSAD